MVQQQMKQERDQARQMKTRLQETEQKIAAKEKDVLELKTRLKQSEAKVEEVVTKAKASQEEARKFAKDAQNKIAEANANASRPVETVAGGPSSEELRAVEDQLHAERAASAKLAQEIKDL